MCSHELSNVIRHCVNISGHILCLVDVYKLDDPLPGALLKITSFTSSGRSKTSCSAIAVLSRAPGFQFLANSGEALGC